MDEQEERDLLARIDLVMAAVRAELVSATMKFGSMASAHEGWAVIWEEVDELWHEVRNNKHGDPTAMLNEARQIAAMGARFMLDIGQHNMGSEKDRPAPVTGENRIADDPNGWQWNILEQQWLWLGKYWGPNMDGGPGLDSKGTPYIEDYGSGAAVGAARSLDEAIRDEKVES